MATDTIADSRTSICTRCSLLCDDVAQCPLASQETPSCTATNRVLIKGQPATAAVALDRARQLLNAASQPLVFGLVRHGVSVQRAAISLADQRRAVLDVELTAGERAAIVAEQTFGVLSATLGEIRQRADTLVFWNADPRESHPRLLEQLQRPAPREEIKRFYVDLQGVPGWESAPWTYVPLDVNAQTAWLRESRAEAQGISGPPTFAMTAAQRTLNDAVRESQYLAVFWRPWEGEPTDNVVGAHEFFRWLAAWNQHHAVVSLPLSINHVTTAQQVMTWQTGYPCSVSFTSGFPEYDPHRWIGQRILADGETDVAVLIGCQRMPFPTDIPIIAIDCDESIGQLAEVAIQSDAGMYGAADDYFRLDGLVLRANFLGDLPPKSAADWVKALC